MIEKLNKPQEKYERGFDWLEQLQQRNKHLEPSWQSIALQGLGYLIATTAILGAFGAVAANWISHNV